VTNFQSRTEIRDRLAVGQIVILSGDALRGGDIDFAMAANRVTPEKVNFMAIHGRGLICLGMTSDRAWKLGISPQNRDTDRSSGRPFGVSIEASTGVDTGISAHDRAETIRIATADNATASDIVTPGHVFPLIADPGGVAARRSTLEAGIALCEEAGLGDAVVLCAVMREDGSMARTEDMAAFCADHDIAMFDISELADV
jgi:3,4-dihydroxy 2-butanone 4-phosphate synthase/GTP cyclohydrolase II